MSFTKEQEETIDFSFPCNVPIPWFGSEDPIPFGWSIDDRLGSEDSITFEIQGE